MRGAPILAASDDASSALKKLQKSVTDEEAVQIVEFSISYFRKYENHKSLNFHFSKF
jgi:hypothetical protein